MNRFITPDYPARHQGLLRLSHVVDTLRHAGHRLRGARGLATLVLAGAVSALVVVADQVVNTWADGQLFAAWVALWAVIFSALALFSDVLGGWGRSMTATFERWSEQHNQRIHDERLLAAARFDTRIMAEIEAALQRAGHDGIESK